MGNDKWASRQYIMFINLPNITTCNILCQSWCLRPLTLACFVSIFHMEAPYLVGVVKLHILLVSTHNVALYKVLPESSCSNGHKFNFMATQQFTLTCIVSFLLVICQHKDSPTYALDPILKSYQWSRLSYMDNISFISPTTFSPLDDISTHFSYHSWGPIHKGDGLDSMIPS